MRYILKKLVFQEW